MDETLKPTSYIFDFRDALAILTENPAFSLSKSQYEDVLYFICEEMSLDITVTMDSISIFNMIPEKVSVNFYNYDESSMQALRFAMMETAVQLWVQFKNKNMFDIMNHENLSFPFVLTSIISSNLIFMKDNVISSNEVNLFG